jgi:hypothetical protein
MALERQAGRGLISQIEEISACGDKVMVVIRTPGVDRVRAHQAEHRNSLVLTLAQERIRMRACRDRDEARAFAGITGQRRQPPAGRHGMPPTPVPCQNSHTSSDLASSLLVRLLSGTH